MQERARDLLEGLKTAEGLRKSAEGTVASLNEDLARKRSLLAAEVDRYMPLVYARHLLNAAVSRFEKENQPEMIATVSRLLAQMTGGKYVEFDRSGGGKQLPQADTHPSGGGQALSTLARVPSKQWRCRLH